MQNERGLEAAGCRSGLREISVHTGLARVSDSEAKAVLHKTPPTHTLEAKLVDRV